MKNTNKFVFVLLILSSLILTASDCQAAEPQEGNPSASKHVGRVDKTESENTVIGWGLLTRVSSEDVSRMSEREKEDAIEKGLRNLKKCFYRQKLPEKSIPYAVILAEFYETHPDEQKASFWKEHRTLVAKRGAERGDVGCMVMIGYAYFTGDSYVIEDRIEACKWLYLAKSCGEKMVASAISNDFDEEERLEAQERAKSWAENHKNIFQAM